MGDENKRDDRECLTTIGGELARAGRQDDLDVEGRLAFANLQERLFDKPLASVRVGRYTLLRKAGQGKMGVVYIAYDETLDRKVAIKFIQQQASIPAGRERILREAKAMARLSHANVVPVYEVGEHEDQVYVAMEFVGGQTLTQWLEKKRSWREVVAKFTAVGKGLAMVHRQGLVHRDFKPDNVLIDADGTPKVADFGLASMRQDEPLPPADRRDEPEPQPDAGLTATGAAMGTPAYMSPQQHRGEAADASCDQFAFCVSLYAALYGRLPYDFQTMEELRAAVTRGEIRDRPRNSKVPRWLHRLVVQGLHVDREQRHPSMDALLDRLQRGLRLQWMPLVVLGVLVLVAATVFGFTARTPPCTGAEQHLQGVWDQADRDRVKSALLGTKLRFAPATWDMVRNTLDGYRSRWLAAHRQACMATHRGEQSGQMLDLRMGCLQRARRELEARVDMLAQADAQVAERAHTVIGALPSISACSDLEALQAEVPPPERPETAAAVEAARAKLSQSKTLSDAGKYEKSLALAQTVRDQSADLDYPPFRAEIAYLLGLVQDHLGRYTESEQHLTKALRLGLESKSWKLAASAAMQLASVVGDHAGRPKEGLNYIEFALGLVSRSDVPVTDKATAYRFFAVLLSEQARYEEAEKQHRKAIALLRQSLGPEHLHVAFARNDLANVLVRRGKLEEAEHEYRKALEIKERILGAEHPSLARTRTNLGRVLEEQGKYAEAALEHRKALSIRIESLGAGHPAVASAQIGLANALKRQGQYAEAEELLRAALALRIETLGPDHPRVASSRNDLAAAMAMQGRHQEAEQEFLRALASLKKTRGAEHPQVAATCNNIANVLRAQGNQEGALKWIKESLRVWQKVVGPEHPRVAETRTNMGRLLTALGRLHQAEDELRDALAVKQKVLGPDHPQVALSYTELAACLMEQKRYREAEEENRKALKLTEENPKFPDSLRIGALLGLGRTLMAQKKYSEALPFLKQALDLVKLKSLHVPQVAQAAFVLARGLWGTEKHRPTALELAREARSVWLRDEREHSEELERIDAWLIQRGVDP